MCDITLYRVLLLFFSLSHDSGEFQKLVRASCIWQFERAVSSLASSFCQGEAHKFCGRVASTQPKDFDKIYITKCLEWL